MALRALSCRSSTYHTEGSSAPLTGPEQHVSKQSQNCRRLHLGLQGVWCKPAETLAFSPVSYVQCGTLSPLAFGPGGSCWSWQLPILTSSPPPLPLAAGGTQPEAKRQRVLQWRRSGRQGCTPRGFLCKASTALWGQHCQPWDAASKLLGKLLMLHLF